MAEIVRQRAGWRFNKGLVHAWKSEPVGEGWHPNFRLLTPLCGGVSRIIRHEGDTLNLPVTCILCERKTRQEVE